MPLSSGDKLGPYQLLSPLGAGGMGEVYRARDHRLERDVAIKLLAGKYGDPHKFEQEAKALAALNHPNIVGIYEFAGQGDTSYLVSELVQGETLRAAMMKGLSARQAIDIAAQICDGLGAAHALGIAHRDLKPENVMLTREGMVKILDFGIARRMPAPATGREATTVTLGLVMGTIGYLSPEQAAGQESGPAADIFSVGVLLYEMLSGKRPFERPTAPESMTATLREDPEPLADSVPPALRQMVMRCLEKTPAKRFQSAVDLAFALRSLSTSTGSVAPVPMQAPASSPARPWKLIAGLTAVALVAGFLLRHALSDNDVFPASAVHMNIFAASPETESHPEFSPDGKFAAYLVSSGKDPSRELVVRPMKGPPSEPLARGVKIGRIAWTPDGNRILFLRDNSVWSVTPAGGEPKLVLKGYSSFTLSHDGNHLLVLQQDDGKRWQVLDSSPPGEVPKPLIDLPPDPTSQPGFGRFAPDGSKYAVEGQLGRTIIVPFRQGAFKPFEIEGLSLAWYPDSRHMVFRRTASSGASEIIVADSGLVPSERIVFRTQDTIIRLSLSPDGKKLLFSLGPVRYDLIEQDLDTQKASRTGESRSSYHPGNWSADGSQFLWMSGNGYPESRRIRSQGNDRVFQEITRSTRDWGAGSARLSPDGRRVAYLEENHLWVFAGGGKPVRLAPAPAPPLAAGNNGPCWSIDGKHLAYVSKDGNKNWLERIPSGGGEAKRLTEAAGTTCAWSQDGKWIAQLGAELRFTDAESGQTQVVKDRNAIAGVFNEKGQLYAWTGSTGDWKLAVLEVPSGRELRSEPIPRDAVGSHPAVHPSGRRIAYSVPDVAYDLWMMDMPQPTTGLTRFWRKWTLPPEPSGPE